MTRNTEREDFLTDYDPRWSNDDEREWEDDHPDHGWNEEDGPDDRDYEDR